MRRFAVIIAHFRAKPETAEAAKSGSTQPGNAEQKSSGACVARCFSLA
jgi:hypothetical protein